MREELGLESHVGELIRDERAAKKFQARVARDRLECAVIHDPDQLGGEQHA
jgi:hypothetical protein